MELFITGNGKRVWVHEQTQCEGQKCVIHNNSHHHMRGWALNWRQDAGFMERVCCHGVGHPDPDGLAYIQGVYEKNGKDHSHLGVHGCDGCCRPPENQKPVVGDLVRPSLTLMHVLGLQNEGDE